MTASAAKPAVGARLIAAWRWLEEGLVVIALVIFSGAFEYARWQVLPGWAHGVVVTALVLLATVLACEARRGLIRAALDVWPSLLIVLMALVSVAWSIAPDATLSRAGLLGAATVFALAWAARFEPSRGLGQLVCALSIVGVGTVILDVAGSGVASRGSYDGMHGWFTSRNHLARAMGLAALACGVAAFDVRWRRYSVLGVTGCLVLVALTGSRAGMSVSVGCLIGLAGWAVLVRRGPEGPWAWRIAAVAVVLCGCVVFVQRDALLTWMGRDATLSNRTVLWRLLVEVSGERPWGGFGYGAFWSKGTAPARWVKARFGEYPWHAHNGFLDLKLDLGWIGVSGFVLVLLWQLMRALRLTFEGDNWIRFWPVAYLVYFISSNLAESELVRHESLYWVVYIAVVAQTAKLRFDA